MANSSTTQWIGVIGALGGVILTSIIGFLTAALNHRWQRDGSRLEREQSTAAIQRDAYARCLAATEALDNFISSRPDHIKNPNEAHSRMSAIREEDPEVFDEAGAALVSAQLIAGHLVYEALQNFDTAMTYAFAMRLAGHTTDTKPIRERLIAAMRSEQTGFLARSDL